MIGVNSQIESDSGGNDGVGFAVPSNTISQIVGSLIDDGSVEHAYLGVAIDDSSATTGAQPRRGARRHARGTRRAQERRRDHQVRRPERRLGRRAPAARRLEAARRPGRADHHAQRRRPRPSPSRSAPARAPDPATEGSRMKKRTKLAAGAGAALAVVGAGGALAADRLTPNDESKAVVDDAAKLLGVDPAKLNAALRKALENRIDEAVKAGRLTEEQGKAMKERIEAGDFPLFGGPGFRPSRLRPARLPRPRHRGCVPRRRRGRAARAASRRGHARGGREGEGQVRRRTRVRDRRRDDEADRRSGRGRPDHEGAARRDRRRHQEADDRDRERGLPGPQGPGRPRLRRAGLRPALRRARLRPRRASRRRRTTPSSTSSCGRRRRRPRGCAGRSGALAAP